MSSVRDGSLLRRLSGWYFSKRVLPYWALIMLDVLIVFLSCLFTYWLSNRSAVMYENHVAVFYDALYIAALSLVGARIFKTYSGVVRYSSFVDLLKVAQANIVTLALAVVSYYIFRYLDVESLWAMSPMELLAAAGIGTLAMWGVRVMVKLLYDSVNYDSKAMRALIYGALTGGIGVAKSIRSQEPKQFDLRGFITHERRIRDMQLMGVPVYTLDQDLAEIIRKRRIQAILVSPLRVNEFRENQKIQDIAIAAGCKIFMGQQAREASIRNGELSEEEVSNMQMHEVSVEDLLPRSQIRVDLKSVGEQLEGKRVMITGSAGSIGLEIVRQVAAFKPASMMLIDQAETPQHDLRLMMAREFPDVPAQTVVTSVDRRTRMQYIFESYRPEYVFHAAAYKHVPMMEDNPSEAVLDNIQGTRILADLSVKYGVKKFVMISTDKAVNPPT